MLSRNFIAALVAFVVCLSALQSAASAAIIQIDENLDDNLVPSGFSLTTIAAAGVTNGRLQATAINGTATLRYNAVPANLDRIDISYRGHFGYSRWGTYTEVTFGGVGIVLNHGFNEFNDGINNVARLSGGDISINPANFSNFEYDISVVDGLVSYTGTDSVSNTQAFSLTYANAGILVADISDISFRTHNTTGTEPVWLDDINMQLRTVEVPAPGALPLFALGLIGLAGARRVARARPSSRIF